MGYWLLDHNFPRSSSMRCLSISCKIHLPPLGTITLECTVSMVLPQKYVPVNINVPPPFDAKKHINRCSISNKPRCPCNARFLSPSSSSARSSSSSRRSHLVPTRKNMTSSSLPARLVSGRVGKLEHRM